MYVRFYEETEDSLLKFAVVFAEYQGKWVFCKHKERETYEAPGGHREQGEDILAAAGRELYEETGAMDYDILPVSIYSVTVRDQITGQEEETFGMLYYATIKDLGSLPDSEIERIIITEELPENWTYPLIQPVLLEKIQEVKHRK